MRAKRGIAGRGAREKKSVCSFHHGKKLHTANISRAKRRYQQRGKTLTKVPELDLSARGELRGKNPRAILHQCHPINCTKSGHTPLARAGAGTRFSAASNSRGRLAKTSHRAPVRPLYVFIVSRSSTSCTCAPRVKLARIAHPFRIPVTQGFSCPTQWTRTAVSSIS